MSTALERAAWDYLGRGLSIIALSGKAPNGSVHPHWREDAIFGAPESPEDYAGIQRMFRHPDTTGIGILTGFPYFVVDIDGEEGAQAWAKIAGPAGMPNRWVAKTHHGLHLWYADTVPRQSRQLAPLLDMKADGGYVVAPPSPFAACSDDPCLRPHQSGSIYCWLIQPDDRGPDEAPAQVIALLDEQDALKGQKLVTRQHRTRVRVPQFTDGRFWPSWGFEGLIDSVRTADVGNRNNVLQWAACTMEEDGAEDEDFEQLVAAALTAGLEARETKLTIRSGRKRAGRRSAHD